MKKLLALTALLSIVVGPQMFAATGDEYYTGSPRRFGIKPYIETRYFSEGPSVMSTLPEYMLALTNQAYEFGKQYLAQQNLAADQYEKAMNNLNSEYEMLMNKTGEQWYEYVGELAEPQQ